MTPSAHNVLSGPVTRTPRGTVSAAAGIGTGRAAVTVSIKAGGVTLGRR
ncbi:hypothetical protein [Paracoccus luteus]|nr:hypothetical protein [Paracoccus luteus]